jgi:hypothetical protein
MHHVHPVNVTAGLKSAGSSKIPAFRYVASLRNLKFIGMFCECPIGLLPADELWRSLRV